jgi:phosphoglycerol transferase
MRILSREKRYMRVASRHGSIGSASADAHRKRNRSALHNVGAIALLLTLVAISLWTFVLPAKFDIAMPIAYGDGDSLQSAAYVKRVLETHWFPLRTKMLGAPFGAADFDYPEAEAANYLLFAALGVFSQDWVTVANLHVLLAFFLSSLTAFLFFRWLGIRRALAIVGSILFAFLPYHFIRLVPLSHILLASYWNVPLAVWVALCCWPVERGLPATDVNVMLRRTSIVLALIAIATGGIYYAFFGCFLILVAATAAAVETRSFRSAIPGVASITVVCLAVVAQLLPTLYLVWRIGPNAEAASRGVFESEIYGMKLVQLAVPQPNHPSQFLRDLSTRYAEGAPLVDENQAAALGVLGAIGIVILCVVGFVRLVRGGGTATIMDRLALLAGAAIALGTIGGLGAFFAMTISSMIRAYNRVSIFIGLLAIAALMLALGHAVQPLQGRRQIRKPVLGLGIAGLLIFGLWDQSARFQQTQIADTFLSDRQFFRRVEAALPPHSSVYQLPYHPYPEVGPMHLMKDYEHFRGYLHASSLRWSYGGMKGRHGDLWLRALNNRPLAEQISLAAQSGFGAIYLDRHAYQDGGAAIEKILRETLGQPIAASADGSMVVFRMQPTGEVPARLTSNDSFNR